MSNSTKAVIRHAIASDGVITRREAMALGMNPRTLDRHLSDGTLVKVATSVYALPGVLALGVGNSRRRCSESRGCGVTSGSRSHLRNCPSGTETRRIGPAPANPFLPRCDRPSIDRHPRGRRPPGRRPTDDHAGQNGDRPGSGPFIHPAGTGYRSFRSETQRGLHRDERYPRSAGTEGQARRYKASPSSRTEARFGRSVPKATSRLAY